MTKPQRLLQLSLVFIAATLVLAAGCKGTTASLTQIVEDVSPQEAFTLIQENNNNPNFMIIDVRTPGEFSEGHIEGAINVDYRSAAFSDEINNFDKNKEYLIYCRSGNRSRGALEVMSELGFALINHLLDGIIGWNDAGYPIVQSSE